jgi:hypothetical protein
MQAQRAQGFPMDSIKMQFLPAQKFIYSFDLADAQPRIHAYPETTKAAAERYVAEVIYESFVIPGDQDYLMARLLALKGLPRGFYWAAAQTVEKYLKALLLMRGCGVASYRGHPLLSLLNAAISVEPSLGKVDISRHQSIAVSEKNSALLQQFSVNELLVDLESHGASDNRYNAVGIEYNTGHLFALDSFAHHVRALIGAPPIGESHKELSGDLVACLSIANPWFCGHQEHSIALPSEEMPLKAHGTVTTLDFISNNQRYPECIIAFEWLSKKMQVPKKLRGK